LEFEIVDKPAHIATRQEFERQIFARVEFSSIRRLSHYTYTNKMTSALTAENYLKFLNSMSHLTPEEEHTKLPKIATEIPTRKDLKAARVDNGMIWLFN